MDLREWKYRVAQIDNIEGSHDSPYLPKIKITSPNGQTNHLDITWEELKGIEDILLHKPKNLK
jgi:hypothetical protein